MDEIIAALEALPSGEIDRAAIESAIGVRKRRALQLMSGLPGRTIGTSAVVDRDALIARLRAITDTGEYSAEAERRNHFASMVDQWRRERMEHPQVLVEAPVRVVSQQLRNLPVGVTIVPGRITVEFAEPKHALEKLLALAMAIGNDCEQFEEITRPVS